MLTLIQAEELSRKYKTNTTVVAREYLQLLFLQNFYEISGSEAVFFKGGTAIHFLMDGFCFSEDLDFTVQVSEKRLINLVWQSIGKMRAGPVSLEFKEKKTITGKSYLLTLPKGMVDFPIFVRLDFSFREKTLQPEKNIIKTEFPVIFSSYVYHLGGEEILAEKIRAILTRDKARDLFDLWFLLAKGYQINKSFIKEKMAYYPRISFSWKELIKKIENYDLAKFKDDLLPFIPIDKRAKIEEMFEIVKEGIIKEVSKKVSSS